MTTMDETKEERAYNFMQALRDNLTNEAICIDRDTHEEAYLNAWITIGEIDNVLNIIRRLMDED